jgi:hypothetical protein
LIELKDEFLPETIEYFIRTCIMKKEALDDMLNCGLEKYKVIADMIFSVGMPFIKAMDLFIDLHVLANFGYKLHMEY